MNAPAKTRHDARQPPGDGLTTRELEYVEAILACPTMEAAAKSAGASRSTLYRALQRPNVRAYFALRAREIMGLGADKLRAAFADAVGVVVSAVRGKKVEPGKLRAAELILNSGLAARLVDAAEVNAAANLARITTADLQALVLGDRLSKPDDGAIETTVTGPWEAESGRSARGPGNVGHTRGTDAPIDVEATEPDDEEGA